MRICILGVSSFDDIRVGANHIAESLSYLGHEVDYVVQPISIFRMFCYKSYKKFLKHCKLKEINIRLREIGQICIVPGKVLKLVENTRLEKILFNLNRKLVFTKGNYIENKRYDLCIFFATDGFYFVRKVNADKYIFRYQDIFEKLPYVIPKATVKYERYIFRNFPIYSVVAVNNKIAQYVKTKNNKLPVKVIPNGISFKLFENSMVDKSLEKTKSKNIIYVGSLGTWINLKLILDTAEILKDYYFHIYAKWIIEKPSAVPSNVFINDFIPYEEVPKKLKACSVGIIPFNSTNEERKAESPLKYYQYLMCGLGVASTSYGMDINNKFVYFGNTPQEFAIAILEANKNKENFMQEKMEELKEMDWDIISTKIIE